MSVKECTARAGLSVFVFLLGSSLLAGCTASLSGPTLAERMANIDALYEDAQKSMTPEKGKQPDYKKAAELYERAARQGSPKAAYALGALYRDGSYLGLNMDEMQEKSFFWMLDAAEGGWTQAQYEVAMKYAQGSGTGENAQKALYWLEKAANSHHPLAQRFLGTLYLNGSTRGRKLKVKPDPQKAAHWYLRAARNDDGPSQAAIGFMYMTGRGVKKDLNEAKKWNALAASKGDAGAQRRMLTLEKALETEGKRETQVNDILTLREAYQKGNVQAGSDLGRLYYYSPAPNNNVSRAIGLFRETASKVPASALMLGVAAEEGKGVKQNFAEAVDWYKKAATGAVEANAYLADAYLEGKGVPANEAEAVRLLEEGAAKSDVKCLVRLAQLYSLGKGVPRDYEKALDYAQMAADKGEPLAMNMLGAMYEKGVGATKDIETARHWYRQLAAYNPADTDFIRIESFVGLKRMGKAAEERLGK